MSSATVKRRISERLKEGKLQATYDAGTRKERLVWVRGQEPETEKPQLALAV